MLTRLQLGINPIIVKELRSRMRDKRAFITLTAMLVILGGSSYLLYRLALATSTYSSAPLSPQIGQILFIALAFLELMAICAIAPAVTTGAISGEREKQTYEMLMATPLHPASILWGKLVSALSYVFLLIFAAIPMASLIFIFGGVTLREMLKGLVVLFVLSITLGTIGLFMSVWLGRTMRATVASYLVVVALVGGPLIAYIATGIIRDAEPPRWILVVNPLSALFSAVTPTASTGGTLSNNLLWALGIGLGGNMGILTGSSISQVGIPRPLYHYSLPVYGLISLSLYLLSTRLVRPTQRWKISRREILIVLAILLLFGGVVSLAFLSSADRYENVDLSQAGVWSSTEAFPRVVEAPVWVEEAPVPMVEVSPPTPLPAPLTSESESGGVITTTDSAAIYAAVLRELYTVDHTYAVDDPPNFPIIYIYTTTDDTVGDPAAALAEPTLITEELQVEISRILTDSDPTYSQSGLPAEFMWVENEDEVPFTPTNSVDRSGAIVKLGNIFTQPDGSVMVSASLYMGELEATGKTYILNFVEGSWRITGSTGVQWVR